MNAGPGWVFRRRRAGRSAAWASTLALCLLGAGQAHAVSFGVARSGAPFVCGGASAEDRLFLQDVGKRYSLWLEARNRADGKGLTGAHVRLIDAHNHLVFDRVMQGPWLLIDLPEGRVKVEATYAGELQRWYLEAHPESAPPQALFFNAEG
jgi:hypothetical protein